MHIFPYAEYLAYNHTNNPTIATLAMGSYQSKLPPNATPHEKAVLDRLQALRLETEDELVEGYDYVRVSDSGNGKANEKAGGVAKAHHPEQVLVSVVAKWQDALLKDPKNRYV